MDKRRRQRLTGCFYCGRGRCYFCRTLRERRLPRFAYDKEAMLVALDRLAALETAGARIFFGHDPEFWQTVPQAPTAIT